MGRGAVGWLNWLNRAAACLVCEDCSSASFAAVAQRRVSFFLFLSPYKPCSFLALRFRETSAVVAVAKLGASPPSPPRLFKMTERSEELDSWITNWERQCIEEVESSPDLESQIQNEKDTSSQKLWLLFQNSATCVAQLYKGTHPTPARPRQHRVASCESLKSKNGGDHGNEA